MEHKLKTDNIAVDQLDKSGFDENEIYKYVTDEDARQQRFETARMFAVAVMTAGMFHYSDAKNEFSKCFMLADEFAAAQEK